MENTNSNENCTDNKIRDVRLTTLRDAKRLLSRTINQVRKGKMDNSTAKVIGYLTNIFIGACSQTEISERIDSIEAILQGELNEN